MQYAYFYYYYRFSPQQLGYIKLHLTKHITTVYNTNFQDALANEDMEWAIDTLVNLHGNTAITALRTSLCSHFGANADAWAKCFRSLSQIATNTTDILQLADAILTELQQIHSSLAPYTQIIFANILLPIVQRESDKVRQLCEIHLDANIETTAMRLASDSHQWKNLLKRLWGWRAALMGTYDDITVAVHAIIATSYTAVIETGEKLANQLDTHCTKAQSILEKMLQRMQPANTTVQTAPAPTAQPAQPTTGISPTPTSTLPRLLSSLTRPDPDPY